MEMEQPDFGYTGLHAFVFIHEVDPGTNIRTVIDALRVYGPPPEGPVMFASEWHVERGFGSMPPRSRENSSRSSAWKITSWGPTSMPPLFRST